MIESCHQFAKKLRSFARLRSLPAQASLCSAAPGVLAPQKDAK
jgi:hypothetical protein